MLNDFFKKYDILIILIIAVISRLLLAFKTVTPILWDAAVYMLNAKWFIGSHVYLELIRPPVWPLILSFFYLLNISDNGMVFVSLLFSALSIVMTYLLAKELFGTKAGIIASLLLMFTPLHIVWSTMSYTEIPASLFLLISLYFLYKGLNNEKFQYLSVFFASIAFLTRYPLVLLFPSIIICLWMQKKMNLKKFLLMTAVFITPVIPWMVYNMLLTESPIFSFVYGMFWVSQASSSPFWYFLVNSPTVFSVLLVPIAFSVLAIRDYKNKEIQIPLIFLVLFLAYSAFMLEHKELRYLLPVVPLFAILASKYLSKFNWKILLLLIPLFAISAYHSNYIFNTEFYNCPEIITSSQNLSGTVYSVFWPQTALYGNVTVAAPRPTPDKIDILMHNTSSLDRFIDYDSKISYVVVADDRYAWIDYTSNFSFWDSIPYLLLQKQINGSCFAIRIYKVIY